MGGLRVGVGRSSQVAWIALDSAITKDFVEGARYPGVLSCLGSACWEI